MGEKVYASAWERVQEAGIALREAQTPAERHIARIRLRNAAIQWVQSKPLEDVERALEAVLDAEEDADYDAAQEKLLRALKRWLRPGKGSKSAPPQDSLF